MGSIRPVESENIIIHKYNDRFAAWPFNGGVWKYKGDEIVVGFQSRSCHYSRETRYQLFHQ